MLEALALVPDPDEASVVSEVADSEGLRDSVREDAIEELVSLSLAGARPARTLALDHRPLRGARRHCTDTRRGAQPRHRSGARAPHSEPGCLRPRHSRLSHGPRRSRRGSRGHLAEKWPRWRVNWGILRSGVRLAAAAVEFDPTDATRARAAKLAESFSERAGSQEGSSRSTERAGRPGPEEHGRSERGRCRARAATRPPFLRRRCTKPWRPSWVATSTPWSAPSSS